jgi:hypothetical protein
LLFDDDAGHALHFGEAAGRAAASIPRSARLVPLQKISWLHDFQTVETHPHQGTEITLVQGQEHIGKGQRREKNRPIFCRREDEPVRNFVFGSKTERTGK